METCQNCKFWNTREKCRRFPEHKRREADEWCGEYKNGFVDFVPKPKTYVAMCAECDCEIESISEMCLTKPYPSHYTRMGCIVALQAKNERLIIALEELEKRMIPIHGKYCLCNKCRGWIE